MSPADRAVSDAHGGLPGLGALLDPEILAALTAPWGTGYRIDRLRFKPGTSVVAVAQAPELPRLILRAVSPAQQAVKLEKSVAAAKRYAERVAKARRKAQARGEARTPVAVSEQPGEGPSAIETVTGPRSRTASITPSNAFDTTYRVFVAPGGADRHLKALGPLLPDTGLPVVPRRLWPELVDLRSGPVTTLSHNPSRRFVGRFMPRLRITVPEFEHGLVVRLYADRPATYGPFVPGRTWAPGDQLPDIAAEAAAQWDAHEKGTGVQPVSPWRRHNVARSAQASARWLRAVDHCGYGWSTRLAALERRFVNAVREVPLRPAHGDYSFDQVVIRNGENEGRPHVLDWDRAGWWPLGWDTASWLVSWELAGHALAQMDAATAGAAGASAPLPGKDEASAVLERAGEQGVPPAVVAACAVMRTPEPFRRRYPNWPELTEFLVTLAERALT